MTIRDLMEQVIIQGAFQIKQWSDKEETYFILAEGNDFELESCNINGKYLDLEIKYMYAVQQTSSVVFEVEDEDN